MYVVKKKVWIISCHPFRCCFVCVRHCRSDRFVAKFRSLFYKFYFVPFFYYFINSDTPVRKINLFSTIPLINKYPSNKCFTCTLNFSNIHERNEPRICNADTTTNSILLRTVPYLIYIIIDGRKFSIFSFFIAVPFFPSLCRCKRLCHRHTYTYII